MAQSIKYIYFTTITEANIVLITGLASGAMMAVIIIFLIIWKRLKSDKMKTSNEGIKFIDGND